MSLSFLALKARSVAFTRDYVVVVGCEVKLCYLVAPEDFETRDCHFARLPSFNCILAHSCKLAVDFQMFSAGRHIRHEIH